MKCKLKSAQYAPDPCCMCMRTGLLIWKSQWKIYLLKFVHMHRLSTPLNSLYQKYYSQCSFLSNRHLILFICIFRSFIHLFGHATMNWIERAEGHTIFLCQIQFEKPIFHAPDMHSCILTWLLFLCGFSFQLYTKVMSSYFSNCYSNKNVYWCISILCKWLHDGILRCIRSLDQTVHCHKIEWMSLNNEAASLFH